MQDIMHCLKLSLLPEYEELRKLPTMSTVEFAKALKLRQKQKRNLDNFVKAMTNSLQNSTQYSCPECSEDPGSCIVCEK